MADKTSVKIGFRWKSRTVEGEVRIQVAELSRKTQRQQFSREDKVQLKVVRRLTHPGKPYTVHRMGPESLCGSGQKAFHFHRQILLGHHKSWDWMRNYLIKHADYLLAGIADRGHVAERKPVGGKPAGRAAG